MRLLFAGQLHSFAALGSYLSGELLTGCSYIPTKIAKRFASAIAANRKKKNKKKMKIAAMEKKQNRGKFHDRQVILL